MPEHDAHKEVRWRQRFENVKRANALLHTAADIQSPSATEKAGIVQLFEVAFELSWHTLKDYLESRGTLVAGPRPVLKEAFVQGMLSNGELWLEALQDRNATTHLYDEKQVNEIVERIKTRYIPEMRTLEEYFATNSETV